MSLASYAVASVACAAAPTRQTLLVARFLLGASAGGLFTNALLTAATVTAEASGYASADERLWLGAAIIALVTTTWTARLRPNVEATT